MAEMKEMCIARGPELVSKFEECSPCFDIAILLDEMERKNLIPSADTVGKFLFEGIRLSKYLKNAKNEGQSTIALDYLNKNDQLVQVIIWVNEKQVPLEAFTENRLFACFHVINYLNNYGKISSLGIRFVWSDVETEISSVLKPLTGAGFEFLGKFIKDTNSILEASKSRLLTAYWVTVHALDYCSITGYVRKKFDRKKNPMVRLTFQEFMQNPSKFYGLITNYHPRVDKAKKNFGIESVLCEIPEFMENFEIEYSAIKARASISNTALAAAARELMKRNSDRNVK